MNKEIVIATNNRGKQKEYLEMLNPIGYMVLTPRDLCVESNPEENGKNYRENSYIKALALSKLVHRPVIADDSGFEVEGLDGFPGLYSSRFADEYGGDYHKAGLALNEERQIPLLQLLIGKGRRQTFIFRRRLQRHPPPFLERRSWLWL